MNELQSSVDYKVLNVDLNISIPKNKVLVNKVELEKLNSEV